MRWHHLTGLAFGVTTTTWVLSGLLSMNPLSINPSRSPAEAELLSFSGTPFTPTDFMLPPAAAIGSEAIETHFLHYDGQPFYKVTHRDGSVRMLPAQQQQPRVPTVEALLARASSLIPTTPIERSIVLTEYDDYYYTRRPENGGKALPVIRIQFADEAHTWFHIDPITGQVLERTTRFNRIYRWLYNGLHSWDIRWLWERRPLWDIAVITFSLGGFALSSIGVVAGIRRLRWELGTTPLRPRSARLKMQRNETAASI
jgi:hypothetical protein